MSASWNATSHRLVERFRITESDFAAIAAAGCVHVIASVILTDIHPLLD
jgi:hypothetical protein